MEKIAGYTLVEDMTLTVPGPIVDEDRWVRRTWKERLFSRPWKPLISKKQITVKVQTYLPDPQHYFIHKNKEIVGHPQTLQKLKQTTEEQEKLSSLNNYYTQRFSM
jgi:hypothetical protein